MILVIDNYDSFTYNLVHFLRELGAEVRVERNDAISADEAMASGADAFLLSPGPCTPNEAGICLDMVAACAENKKPLLGVCLGHQAIGQYFGGTVRQGGLMHGKTSPIAHQGQGVFADIPSPFTATRYHSLIVDEGDLPDCLEIHAMTADEGADQQYIMGFGHKTLPIFGVQFHPESIATQYGHKMLANFMEIAELLPDKARLEQALKNSAKVSASLSAANTQKAEA